MKFKNLVTTITTLFFIFMKACLQASKRCAWRGQASIGYAGAHEDQGGFSGFRCVRSVN